MSVCFVVTGPIHWASSRFRAYWPAEHMKDASVVVYQNGAQLPRVDNYVFIKVADPNLARLVKEQGRLIWDLCDPIHWFDPVPAQEMVELADVLTASNEGLAADFGRWAERDVTVIPDRVNLNHYNRVKEHHDARPVRFVWYGSAQNRPSIFGALAPLMRLQRDGYDITLTIVDDKPDWQMRYNLTDSPVFRAQWSLHTEIEIMMAHDIALLPPYPGIWGTVKSNNKKLTAWACGLPVVDGMRYDENLIKLVDSAMLRREAGHGGRAKVEEAHDVRQTARDWEALLA